MMRIKRICRSFDVPLPPEDDWVWFDDHQTIGILVPEESDESDNSN